MNNRKRKTAADGPGTASESSPANPGSGLNPPAPKRPHLSSGTETPLQADSYFRKLYSSEPDFKQLAKQDAAFASFLQDNGQLDFSDPAAVMQLTKTLLLADFGLKIDLPDDRLCPPVPNRHSYILWLKGLLDSSSYESPLDRRVYGLDIGTGASCIYPLLGAVQRPWTFAATEIDQKSFEYANRNVQLNDLGHQIRILKRKPTDRLIPLGEIGVQSLDFAMMNPPFYASKEEMTSSAKEKARPPHSACTGVPIEMVCEGGEVEHVSRMLRESLTLRERVQWYTAMLGKSTSMEPLVNQLRQHGINNFAVTEFIQGNKTRRWALGWSFQAMRPAEGIARGIKAAHWRKLLPTPSSTVLFTSQSGNLAGSLIKRVLETVEALDLMSWSWDNEASKGIGRATENVWGRAWRRRRFRVSSGHGTSQQTAPTSENCRLGFTITVEVGRQATTASLHWIEGHDQSMFESLSGFLQGRLKEMDNQNP